MRRIVLPEKLDSLSEDDRAAHANRSDLRRINCLMGNFRWLRKTLRGRLPTGGHATEWAAGDGGFGVYLIRRRKRWDMSLTGIDLWRRPAEWPENWKWNRKNLLDLDQDEITDVVVGNFILHQFEDAQLAELGGLLKSEARLLCFNETTRSHLAIFLGRLVGWVFAMHPVTRHDAEVSVRAGFCGEELPQLLGLSEAEWSWQIETTLRGSYRMVAERRET